MKHCLTVVLFMGLMATACNSNRKRLEPETMKVVLWDIMKIDEFYARLMIKDSTLRNTKEFLRLYEEVYALHHISKQQFDDTYRFYESHPAQFKVLLDSVDALADRERTVINSTPPPKR